MTELERAIDRYNAACRVVDELTPTADDATFDAAVDRMITLMRYAIATPVRTAEDQALMRRFITGVGMDGLPVQTHLRGPIRVV